MTLSEERIWVVMKEGIFLVGRFGNNLWRKLCLGGFKYPADADDSRSRLQHLELQMWI